MHSAAQHERGVFGRAAPCTRSELEPQQQQKPVSCGEAGWVRLRGSLQVRPCKLGRRIHAVTPPEPDPPRLRQISAICSRSTPCVDQSLSDNEINRDQIRFPTENGSDPMTSRDSRTYPTVTRKLSGVGRCGQAGPFGHGWRHRAPMGEGALLAKHCFASARTHSRQRLGRSGGLRRVLPAHTAPPNQQKTRAALALALALAVAGQRPALPQV